MTFAELAVGDTFLVVETGIVYVKMRMSAAERQGGDPPPSDIYGAAHAIQLFRADTLVERIERK